MFIFEYLLDKFMGAGPVGWVATALLILSFFLKKGRQEWGVLKEQLVVLVKEDWIIFRSPLIGILSLARFTFDGDFSLDERKTVAEQIMKGPADLIGILLTLYSILIPAQVMISFSAPIERFAERMLAKLPAPTVKKAGAQLE